MNVGGMTPDEVYRGYLKNTGKDGQFIVHTANSEYSIGLDDYFKHSVMEEDFAKYLGDRTFMEFLMDSPARYTMEDEYIYAGGIGNAVAEWIKSGGYEYTEAADAYFDTNELVVIPEIYGTEIVPEIAAMAAEDAISIGAYEISLNDEKFYVKPDIKGEDIEKKYADVLSLLKWKAEYSVSDYVIRMSDYKDRIKVNEDGTYKVDDSFLKQAVLELSKTIDQKYDKIKFNAKKDGDITVKGGTYGQIMKNSKEIEYLKEKLKKNESVSDREPAWLCKPLTDGENPENYVEVDLSEQHVWHYKDGKLCCESDCVTGNTSLKRGTPEGAFYISEKIPGKYLTGEDYKTWVDRWMRLTNSGVGLHDAKWKKKFGGNIYKTNGSHGCINLPVKYAYSLYDEVFVGMLVVIHG